MMGCFSVPKADRTVQRSLPKAGSEHSGLLCNKPMELPNPSSVGQQFFVPGAIQTPTRNAIFQVGNLNEEVATMSDASMSRVVRDRAGRRIAFSGPLELGSSESMAAGESRSSISLSGVSSSCVSSDEDKKACGLRSLRRATSFGGRPQPLPLPVVEGVSSKKQLHLPLPAPKDVTAAASISSLSSAEMRYVSGTNSFMSTRRANSFMLEDGPGSWTSRRGRVVPVSGLPLPPASVASKLLPSLAAYEFSDLLLATDNFAPCCCLEKGTFGAVYGARIKDLSSENDCKSEMAVLRLPASTSLEFKEWRSEVQLLAQLTNSNICAVKGYCTQDEGSRSTKEGMQERLLVFYQPANGSLYDHLFGSRCTTSLNWAARVTIALGAARGLSYIHDRAPLQIVYRDFKSSSVLLDEDYFPKLAGYGLAVTNSPIDKQLSFAAIMKISQAHARSNVWSFGVLLLELLTGKSSRDAVHFGDEKNFVQWSKQFMKEESKLSHILDPRMEGLSSLKGAVELAMLVLQCVGKKELQRPSMSEVVEALKVLKAKYCNSSRAGKTTAASIGVPSQGKPEMDAQGPQDIIDTQTTSDASSSESEEAFAKPVSKLSKYVLRPVQGTASRRHTSQQLPQT